MSISITPFLPPRHLNHYHLHHFHLLRIPFSRYLRPNGEGREGVHSRHVDACSPSRRALARRGRRKHSYLRQNGEGREGVHSRHVDACGPSRRALARRGRVLMFALAVGRVMVLPVEVISGRKQSGARGEPSRRARRRAPLSGRAAYCEPALLRVAEPPSLVSRGGGATAVLGTAVLFDDLCRRVVAGLVASATIKTEG